MVQKQAKRAVGYTRVSDDSQAEPDKASLQEQERSIRGYCEQRGYDLLEVYSDVGKRWNANRPGFQRMITWGKERPRPFDVIVVWRSDRIVGSASTVAALEPLLDQAGVDIEGVTEQINKNYLLFNAQVAKGETEAKRERGKLGVKTAVLRGHFPGCAPYGRRLDKERREIVIDEQEAGWYREMFAWSIAGDGDSKIASRLNGLGVPTHFQGRTLKNGRTVDKGWTADRVGGLLKDPAAYGEVKIQVKGGESFTFTLPPVVDRATFERALLARQSRTHFGHRKTNRAYLISPRKGKCVECGYSFHLESRSYRVVKKNAKGELKVYERKTLSPALICRGMHIYPHIHQCRTKKYINFDRVQNFIVHKVGEFLSTDDFALACAMPKKTEIEKQAQKLGEAKKSLAQTIQETNFVVSQGRRGIIPQEVFETQMGQLSRLLEFKQNQFKQLEEEYKNAAERARNIEHILPVVELLKGFWEVFQTAEITDRNAASDVRNKDGEVKWVSHTIPEEDISKLKHIMSVLVDSFTIDKDNRVTIQLNLPVIEGIKEDADRCRQLILKDSLEGGVK